MRLLREHVLTVRVLESSPLSSIDQLMHNFSVSGGNTRARMFAVLDQLETLQLVVTTRTATTEDALWSSTARGRMLTRECA